MLAGPAAVDDADAKFFHWSRHEIDVNCSQSTCLWYASSIVDCSSLDVSRLLAFASPTPTAARGAACMTTAHGDVETPAFMPVGTQGAVKGVTHRDLEQLGAEILLEQHLSSLSAARRRPDRAARRPARVHRLDAADPDRQRRLSGVQPGRAAHDRRGGRALSIASRRLGASADAGEGGRHPGAARIRHRDGARRVPRAPVRATTRRAQSMERTLRWARRARERFLALRDGAGRRASPSPTPARRSSASCRAACSPSCARRARAARSAIGFEAYAIGGLSVGEPTDVMYDMVAQTTPCLPEDRPRYLMGAGTPAGPRRIGGARHRSVRLRAADAERAGTGSCSPARAASTSRTRATPRTTGRPIPACGCYTCRTCSRAYLRHLFHGRRDQRGYP